MAGTKPLPGVSRIRNKDGTSSWRASEYTPAGRKVARTFRSLAEGNRWKLDLEHSKDHGTYIDPAAGRISLAEYFAHAMARSPKLTPKTVHGYWYIARNWILPSLGEYSLSKLTREVVIDWISDRERARRPLGRVGCVPGARSNARQGRGRRPHHA